MDDEATVIDRRDVLVGGGGAATESEAGSEGPGVVSSSLFFRCVVSFVDGVSMGRPAFIKTDGCMCGMERI